MLTETNDEEFLRLLHRIANSLEIISACAEAQKAGREDKEESLPVESKSDVAKRMSKAKLSSAS